MTKRQKIYEIIFGTDTRAGRNFDLILLVVILFSVVLVMMESVTYWREKHFHLFHQLEIIFTLFFAVEYVTRIIISPKPFRYIFSFWGIIDLLSILPSFVALFIHGFQSIRVVRAFRLLRIFRILQLSRFTHASQSLYRSLSASYYKIMVFLFFVVMVMILNGTLMYVIEDGKNGFDSIPVSIYWAIVTVTTVGFGDITPHTVLGKFLASGMMILGYAVIAVPTGLISVELSRYKEKGDKENLCKNCQTSNPEGSAFCNKCGRKLNEATILTE